MVRTKSKTKSKTKTRKKSKLEKILDIGKKKGHLTYAEINKILPDDFSPEDMEYLLDKLEDLNIDVFEKGKSTSKDSSKKTSKTAEGWQRPETEEYLPSSSDSARIDDPVRLYLM